jgi:TolB-like protein/DNA-binding winged helix-turn-helix (wHTH) protein
MAGNGSNRTQLRFGTFEVDLDAKELRKSGLKVRLQPQPFEVLAILASRPGEVVSREELQQKLWSDDTFVDFDRSLTAAIKRLRTALSDDADTPRYIETIPRRGYRMIVPVVPVRIDRRVDVAPPPRPKRFYPLLLVSVLAGLLLVSFGAYLAFRNNNTQPKRTMLAILPFEKFDSGIEDYFSDGLTEELIAQLGELNPSSLGVIARTSAMHYKGTHQTVADIGHDLRFDYVLEGSVRQQDDNVRITVQLIRVSDQTHLWAHSYDRSREKLLNLETELAQAIAKEISVNLPNSTSLLARTQTRHPASADAQQLYMQGRFYWNKRYGESLKLAQSSFERAIQVDPGYALAYSGLADTDFVLAIAGTVSTTEVMPVAKRAAEKAIQLDPELAEAHISLAQIMANYDWNWGAADREYRRGIQLNANYSIGHLWYGTFLMLMGRTGEAVAELQRAQELDPLSSMPGTFLGKAYYYNREYDKAIAQYKSVLQNDPGFPIASTFLVQVYEQDGKFENAIAEMRRAIPLAGGDVKDAAQVSSQLALGLRAEGSEGYWRKQLELASRISPLDKSALYVRLQRNEEAIQQLNQAFSQHDMWLATLKVDPRWDNIRSDFRVKQLLKRVGLE